MFQRRNKKHVVEVRNFMENKAKSHSKLVKHNVTIPASVSSSREKNIT